MASVAAAVSKAGASVAAAGSKRLKVLIAGSGLTGAALQRLLSITPELRSKLDVTVWDKARAPGGRASTSRGRSEGLDEVLCDLGAQYYTANNFKLQESPPDVQDLLRSGDFDREITPLPGMPSGGDGLLASTNAIAARDRLAAELLWTDCLHPSGHMFDGQRPDKEGQRHFVAPRGMASICRQWLAGAAPEFRKTIRAVDRDPAAGDSGGWRVWAEDGDAVPMLPGREEEEEEKVERMRGSWPWSEDGGVTSEGVAGEVPGAGAKPSRYDAVVLTMPVPQVLRLRGAAMDAVAGSEESVGKALRSVRFSSRWALGLFFKEEDAEAVVRAVRRGAAGSSSGGEGKEEAAGGGDGEGEGGSNIVGRYVGRDESSLVRFVAVDGAKRAWGTEGGLKGVAGAEGGVGVVVHTSVGYGSESMDRSKAEVQEQVMAELKKLLPDLPSPAYCKVQKWKYSQATEPDWGAKGGPGAVEVGHLSASEGAGPLIVAGDGLRASNIEGCVYAAAQAARLLASWAGLEVAASVDE